MAPYNIEGETRVTIKKGPFGLFKQDKISITPLGKIDEGQSVEIVSPNGLEMGKAELQKGVLEISPKGGVVVDLGRIQGFKGTATFLNKNGGEETIWVGSIRTEEDLTVRTEDGKEKVIFRKIPTVPTLEERKKAAYQELADKYNKDYRALKEKARKEELKAWKRFREKGFDKVRYR